MGTGRLVRKLWFFIRDTLAPFQAQVKRARNRLGIYFHLSGRSNLGNAVVTTFLQISPNYSVFICFRVGGFFRFWRPKFC